MRSKPIVRVLRGFDPMNPMHLSETAPIASGVPIGSGELIALRWNSGLNRYEWNKFNATTDTDSTPYISMQDSVQGDVKESLGLTGLSCAGDYEIQTPFFEPSLVYNVDVKLVGSATDGLLKAYNSGTDSAKKIIGRVSRIRGIKQLNSATVHEDSSTSAANSGVIIFQTTWSS